MAKEEHYVPFMDSDRCGNGFRLPCGREFDGAQHPPPSTPGAVVGHLATCSSPVLIAAGLAEIHIETTALDPGRGSWPRALAPVI